MMNKKRKELFQNQKGLCFFCHKHMQINHNSHRDYATFEHLKRKEDGGGGIEENNIVLTHRKCNRRRETIPAKNNINFLIMFWFDITNSVSNKNISISERKRLDKQVDSLRSCLTK